MLRQIGTLLLLILLTAGVAFSLDCPKQPEQVSKDTQVEVHAEVAKVLRVTGGQLQVDTKRATQDLLGKLPNADRLYLEQMMYATYCSGLRDDKSISEGEKSRRVAIYNAEVRRTFAEQSAKPSGKQARPRSSASTAANNPPKSFTAMNAPNGIVIVGDNFGSPSVTNNYGTPQRTISKEDEPAVLDILRQHPGTVSIGYVMEDEPSKLARRMYDLLTAASWTVKDLRPGYGTKPIKGIRVDYHTDSKEPMPDGTQLEIPFDTPQGTLIQAIMKGELSVHSVNPTSEVPPGEVRLIIAPFD